MEGTQHGTDTRRFGNDTLVHTGLFQHLRIGYMVRTHIKEYRENRKENHHRVGGNKGHLK